MKDLSYLQIGDNLFLSAAVIRNLSNGYAIVPSNTEFQ